MTGRVVTVILERDDCLAWPWMWRVREPFGFGIAWTRASAIRQAKRHVRRSQDTTRTVEEVELDV